MIIKDPNRESRIGRINMKVLTVCINCEGGQGIYSINSYNPHIYTTSFKKIQRM